MSYALITGASSGIGLELASVFARNKHDVILVARSTDKLNALKKDLEKSYQVDVRVIPADLSFHGSAQKLFTEVRAQNLKVDQLINNAGCGDHGLFVNAELSKITQMIHVNVTSLTELTHLFLPQMIQGKFGRIMNVASTAAFQPGPLMSVYYATKAFVLFFSEGLFEETKGTGITVTALCPGPTASGFQQIAGTESVPIMSSLSLPSSAEVAEYGYVAMQSGKAIAVQGFMNNILSSAVSFLPRSTARKMVRKLQEAKVSKKI